MQRAGGGREQKLALETAIRQTQDFERRELFGHEASNAKCMPMPAQANAAPYALMT
jgi:hypothetical protein